MKIVIAQNKEESKDKDKDQKPKSAATFITETKNNIENVLQRKTSGFYLNSIDNFGQVKEGSEEE